MWLFEQHGFVSVVSYDPSKDRNKKSQFSKIARNAGTHLLVRARIKADLDMLKKVVPSLVVETDAGADYAYRAVVSRKHFKKFLANSVDELTYHSHFKEQARDNSPEVAGRYNAMMSVWTTMCNLQDVKPWSGYGGYGGGSDEFWGDYGGAGHVIGGTTKGKTSKPYVSPHGSDAKKTKAQEAGAESYEAFIESYELTAGNLSFKRGEGPRTGFKVDDRVEGYFGAGKVIAVEERQAGYPDMVTVEPDDIKKKPAKFLSNYLFPEDLPQIFADEDLSDDDEFDADDMRTLDLEWMSSWVMQHRDLKQFPATRLSNLDDDAFELVTRLMETFSEDDDKMIVDNDLLDQHECEIRWERAKKESDQTAMNQMIADGLVPEKYITEAINFWTNPENEPRSMPGETEAAETSQEA